MVTLIEAVHELKNLRANESTTIGFVPTMGNLHLGHISLLERALDENEVVYFSIFVNPKQFGPNEDYNNYPRTLDSDLKLIQLTALQYPNKKVVVFAPENPEEIFPSSDDQTIAVSDFNHIIEGKFRPDHFDGVATVVYRLFDLTKPNKAYFGLKDYQQYMVIKKMVSDLVIPIEVIGMPIVREPTGLALSSRNQYLSAEEKSEALILSKSLQKIQQLISGKKINLPKAKREIDILLLDPKWNYLEIRDAETLSNDLTHAKKITLLGLYQIKSTRLLDNHQMEIE